MNELSLILIVFGIVCVIVALLYYVFSLRWQIEARARDQYELWCEEELEGIRQQYAELAEKQIDWQYQQWKQHNPDLPHPEANAVSAEKDIVEKEVGRTLPLVPGLQHNPNDARFIDTPVDFVVFDGWDEGEIRKITFIKIQNGAPSALSLAERQVRNVIRHKLIDWEELRVPASLAPASLEDQTQPTPAASSGPVCPQCGKGNRARARFCGHCGTPLTPSAA